MVAFFSPECGHGRDVPQHLQTMYDQDRDEGLAIFGVVRTRTPETIVPGFVQELKRSYSAGSDWQEGCCGYIDCRGQLTMPVLVLVD